MQSLGTRKWRPYLAVSAIAAVAIPLVACSSTAAPENESPSSTATTSLSSLLPDEILQRGSITIAASMDYPPLEFLDDDGVTPVGMDIELGDALGEVLGIRVQWQNASFDGLVAGVAAGRYDLAIGLQDSVETRKEADFVDFFANSNGVAVPPGGGSSIKTVLDLCGMHIGNQRGSNTTVDIAEFVDVECEAVGKPKVNLNSFQDQNQMILAFTTGRVEAISFGMPAAAYILQSQPGLYDFVTFREIVTDLPPNLTAIGIAKDSDELLLAVYRGMKELMDNGKYMELFEKWGLTSLALAEITVNGEPFEMEGE